MYPLFSSSSLFLPISSLSPFTQSLHRRWMDVGHVQQEAGELQTTAAAAAQNRLFCQRSVLDQTPTKKFCSCALASRLGWADSSLAGRQTTSRESTKCSCRWVRGLSGQASRLHINVKALTDETLWKSIWMILSWLGTRRSSKRA